MSVSFHQFIQRCNVLQRPRAALNTYFKNHSTVYKTVLFVDHLFRVIGMTGMMAVIKTALPFSFPINLGICFAGALFYSLTVEVKCPLKFALPAFAGAVAFPIAFTALNSMISGVAFASLGAFALAFASLLPLAGYLTYVVLTVNYDVDHPCTAKC